MLPRIEKSIARFLAIMFAPEGGALVSAFRSNRNGWIKIPEEFERARKNSGLGDTYVKFYESEVSILACLIRFIFPEELDGELEMFTASIKAATEEEKLSFFKQLSERLMGKDVQFQFVDLFPRTKEAREAIKEAFDALSEEEKIAGIRQAQLLLTFFYAYLHNHIALMVHGRKLTTLVPLAIQGNQEAFCKAIQIDKNILTGHPYFKETYERLQAGENGKFYQDVITHLGRPPIQGRIKYPALYLIFTVLDGFGWLEKFTASEILDMCDEAGLDRFQSRIEDESYVIKRRLEYRKFQKIGF
jgi:hypothetical protein